MAANITAISQSSLSASAAKFTSTLDGRAAINASVQTGTVFWAIVPKGTYASAGAAYTAIITNGNFTFALNALGSLWYPADNGCEVWAASSGTAVANFQEMQRGIA